MYLRKTTNTACTRTRTRTVHVCIYVYTRLYNIIRRAASQWNINDYYYPGALTGCLSLDFFSLVPYSIVN